MIWATVSSWSFLLSVKSFSIFGCKEYNQSDFSFDHLVMSMCRVFSCVVGRGCLLWPVGSLGKTLLALALLHSVLQDQICLLLQVSLDSLLLHSSPLGWKGRLFLVLVLEGLVVFIELFCFSFLGISGWDIDLHYSDTEWFALQTNGDLSVVWAAPKCCISDSFVDYGGFSFLLRDSCPQYRCNGHLN